MFYLLKEKNQKFKTANNFPASGAGKLKFCFIPLQKKNSFRPVRKQEAELKQLFLFNVSFQQNFLPDLFEVNKRHLKS
jgi:hypothetical protein